MIDFLKKYYGQVLLLLIPILLGYSIYLYFYFTRFIYKEDRKDFRYYPISLTNEWIKVIEYDTKPKVKHKKCFLIAFNHLQLMDNLKKEFGENYYSDFYSPKYSAYRVTKLSESVFYQEAKEKPKLLLKIYKDEILIETKDIYFSYFFSFSSLEINGGGISIAEILGHWTLESAACYDFSENTHYRLEIINQSILPEYQDVETFLVIRPVAHKV
ncbi:hypothetical protein ACFSAV_03005 [Pasteurella oralis]|uniref:Transmembrane protein n=1 Tax=Pasteurella oralis TaxID=1071947 RepID=A0ABW4NSY1_9PAST